MKESGIAIAGVGLIGGSIAAAIKKYCPGTPILGVGRNAERLDRIRRAGLIDRGTMSLEEAAAGNSLLILCTPVDQIARMAKEALNAGHPGLLVTDGGSVKQPVCGALPSRPGPGGLFLGSHPLAGSEKSGFEHASADLFEHRICVLTPPHDVDSTWLVRLEAFWQCIGARTVCMTPRDHDLALGETSHLPHLIASALAVMISDGRLDFAASGFRDTTRIAAGDPDLWAAILKANADAVLESLGRFEHTIEKFREAIESDDSGDLKNLLMEGKRKRQSLSES